MNPPVRLLWFLSTWTLTFCTLRAARAPRKPRNGGSAGTARDPRTPRDPSPRQRSHPRAGPPWVLSTKDGSALRNSYGTHPQLSMTKTLCFINSWFIQLLLHPGLIQCSYDILWKVLNNYRCIILWISSDQSADHWRQKEMADMAFIQSETCYFLGYFKIYSGFRWHW